MSESPQTTYEWNQIPWRKLEVAVFKLERRIFKASQAGDTPRVHRLQRLLLKSQAAKLLAVRRVTQDNQGKHTAGVDGVKSIPPSQRVALARNLGRLPIGSPTRRVWIPKPGKTEKRPLGIPMVCAYCISFKPVWGFERKVGMGEAYGFGSDLGSRRIQVAQGTGRWAKGFGPFAQVGREQHPWASSKASCFNRSGVISADWPTYFLRVFPSILAEAYQ